METTAPGAFFLLPFVRNSLSKGGDLYSSPEDMFTILERKEGREGREREGQLEGEREEETDRQTDIDQLPPTGIPTRDGTCDLGMCPGQVLNP